MCYMFLYAQLLHLLIVCYYPESLSVDVASKSVFSSRRKNTYKYMITDGQTEEFCLILTKSFNNYSYYPPKPKSPKNPSYRNKTEVLCSFETLRHF